MQQQNIHKTIKSTYNAQFGNYKYNEQEKIHNNNTVLSGSQYLQQFQKLKQANQKQLFAIHHQINSNTYQSLNMSNTDGNNASNSATDQFNNYNEEFQISDNMINSQSKNKTTNQNQNILQNTVNQQTEDEIVSNYNEDIHLDFGSQINASYEQKHRCTNNSLQSCQSPNSFAKSQNKTEKLITPQVQSDFKQFNCLNIKFLVKDIMYLQIQSNNIQYLTQMNLYINKMYKLNRNILFISYNQQQTIQYVLKQYEENKNFNFLYIPDYLLQFQCYYQILHIVLNMYYNEKAIIVFITEQPTANQINKQNNQELMYNILTSHSSNCMKDIALMISQQTEYQDFRYSKKCLKDLSNFIDSHHYCDSLIQQQLLYYLIQQDQQQSNLSHNKNKKLSIFDSIVLQSKQNISNILIQISILKQQHIIVINNHQNNDNQSENDFELLISIYNKLNQQQTNDNCYIDQLNNQQIQIQTRTNYKLQFENPLYLYTNQSYYIQIYDLKKNKQMIGSKYVFYDDMLAQNDVYDNKWYMDSFDLKYPYNNQNIYKYFKLLLYLKLV